MVSELIFSLLGVAVLYLLFKSSSVIYFPHVISLYCWEFLLLLEDFNSLSPSAFSTVVVKKPLA